MNKSNNSLGHGIEIILKNPDDFLKIKETLTRVGIKSKKSNILYQSCCILHKKGQYYILNYKEMFHLDNKENNICADDFNRRDAIVAMLVRWNLCTLKNLDDISDIDVQTQIDIIPFKDKKNYQLVSKYQVGKKAR